MKYLPSTEGGVAILQEKLGQGGEVAPVVAPVIADLQDLGCVWSPGGQGGGPAGAAQGLGHSGSHLMLKKLT